MYPEGQIYEFFRRLAAANNQGAVLAAVGKPDDTLAQIAQCPDVGGQGRQFSEQAIRDTLFELYFFDPTIVMALVQDTDGVMDTIARYDAPPPSKRPPMPVIAYGVPFPRRGSKDDDIDDE